MNFVVNLFQVILGGVGESTYIRFAHITASGGLFFLGEVLIVLIAMLVLTFRPARKLTGFYSGRLAAFARRRGAACVAIFCLCIFGRLVLLTVEPFPEPAVQDEFSYLLASDTLAHGRVSNPVLPSWHHFEPFHILMEPHYASMYFPGFPLFLAFGELIFETPRAGVVICTAFAAASLCWMLQGWLPPVWALIGGLIAVVRIGWFSYFGNTYWGGSAGIVAGCLLLGASARLARKKIPDWRDAVVLAFSLVFLANTRPYEGAFLALPIVAGTFWTLAKRKRLSATLLVPAVSVVIIGAAVSGYYCYCVTGQLKFPQSLQRSQWATAPSLVFLAPDYQHTYQFADQKGLYLKYEMAQTYSRENSVLGYLLVLPSKVFREWHFYVGPALTLALIGFGPIFRSRKYLLIAIASLTLCAALLAETWVQPQYVAVGAGIIYLALITGLRQFRVLSRNSPVGMKLLSATFVALSATFLLRLLIVPIDAWPPSWASRNAQIPAYAPVHQFVEGLPGRQLVIVRYGPDHFWGNSWINNGYDPASQKVIWARDTEPQESNVDLICAFPGRQVLLLRPPDAGFFPPPDTTAPRNFSVSQFLEPYARQDGSSCPLVTTGRASRSEHSGGGPGR